MFADHAAIVADEERARLLVLLAHLIHVIAAEVLATRTTLISTVHHSAFGTPARLLDVPDSCSVRLQKRPKTLFAAGWNRY